LKGCWKSDAGIIATKTQKPITITYCFGADGKGTRTITYDEGGVTCEGPLTASRDGDNLIILFDEAKCQGDDSSFKPGKDVCRPGADNEALCTETYFGQDKPAYENQKFLRK
ncbi:MAG: hypothetical protein JOZ40_14010, partial [Methylobacteriaceae bacterium]|nr:hypothetical protein [Methylobacteriaceae bacterium]